VKGAQGGSGGDGGAGGDGGSADTTINGFTGTSKFGASLEAFAQGQGGGAGAAGAGGGEGGETSAGGTGGAGGDGGAATATISNSSVTDTTNVAIQILADSGAGAKGGAGGESGASLNFGVNGDETTVDIPDNPSGGASGAAIADLTGNSITGPIININLFVSTAAPAFGGAGVDDGPSSDTVNPDGSETIDNIGLPGPTGATGAMGTGSIDFTNNIVNVNTLHYTGDGVGVPNALTLDLTIDEATAAAPSLPNPIALDGAPGGNLEFSGNSFIGNGQSALNLFGAGSGVTIDLLDNTIAIAGSPNNAFSGFTTFDLATGDTVILGTVSRLVNGTTIAQVPVDEVTYYHVELPWHDLIHAEGVLAESWLDTGGRSNFSNRGGVLRLFPDFSAPVHTAGIWETRGYARLVTSGPELAAARALVNARAAAIAPAHPLKSIRTE
jgi:hypothetical protein